MKDRIKLDFSEKILCNLVGKMFEFASKRLHCYEVNFCKAWLNSEICQAIFEMDETLICQSKVYLFHSFQKEINLPEHAGYEMDEAAMYWAGYIFTYWMFSYGISGRELAEQYRVQAVLEQYDTLHTMSNQAAIELMKSECRKQSVPPDVRR